ncbi:hypothetical protein P3T36_001998 [Kitasatospora sp. MAP12-15]|uniref:hypothetical protein n=1 Tax=unclassified Kitasatospora TaxID=2633591 RepID=UPI0024764B57|nr:hypothetical protein [Kitasatospora sp. MAP12-44]MDH6111683.1 hypothetical protein [Kitasatospora sp. MAP12-44]
MTSTRIAKAAAVLVLALTVGGLLPAAAQADTAQPTAASATVAPAGDMGWQ